MTNNELCHYGILGMKWGVRRFQNKDGTRTPLGKKRRRKQERNYRDISDEDLRRSRDARTIYENRDRLSDRELQDRINRLNMENNLRRMAKSSTKSGQLLEKIGNKTLESIAQAVANEIGQKAAKALLGAAGAYAVSKLKGSSTVQFAKWWLQTYKGL